MSRTEKLSDKGEEHEKIEKGKEGEGEMEKEQGALVVDKAPGVGQHAVLVFVDIFFQSENQNKSK